MPQLCITDTALELSYILPPLFFLHISPLYVNKKAKSRIHTKHKMLMEKVFRERSISGPSVTVMAYFGIRSRLFFHVSFALGVDESVSIRQHLNCALQL